MQKRLLLVLLFSFTGLNFLLFAQQNDKKKAEFESFKKRRIAFITKAMDLTADEAKVFWPLCNELQEKKFALNQQARKSVREFSKARKEDKTYSEEEYSALVKLIINLKMQEAQLDKEYTAKFSEIISAQKVFLYLEAERQFAREMMEGQRNNHPK
jgi:Spy/CpxP family protein refolding chaperone